MTLLEELKKSNIFPALEKIAKNRDKDFQEQLSIFQQSYWNYHTGI